MHEGIALYEAGQVNEEGRVKELKKLIESGDIPTIEELNEDFINNNGYFFAGAAL